jgi:pimeloyl-ACP methyl ester carboxylesterase
MNCHPDRSEPAGSAQWTCCVLLSPGLSFDRCLPEVSGINFAPRVKVPVLMLNGRYDFFSPPASSQEPMFRLLGTSREQKLRMLYDAGHDIPRTGIIKKTLDWLDRYLGPVK